MPNPTEKPEPEISPEMVEDTLIELNNSGVFMHIRTLINGDNNFFDTTKGYIQENDESSAGTILDMYLAAIEENVPLAVEDLKEPELKEAIKKAVATDSIERKILLAYWNLDENSPWYQAEKNITSYQTFKNENFPAFNDIDRVISRLEKDGEL
jgi:hypothetical protein